MWRNVDSNTGGITGILIHGEPDRLSVRVWGACVRVDCSWGALSVLRDQLSDSTLNLVWNHGFATSNQTLKLIGDRLEVTEHRHYVDNSGRADLDTVSVFVEGSPMLGGWTGTLSVCVNQWSCTFSFTLGGPDNAVSGYWRANSNASVQGPLAAVFSGSGVTLQLGQVNSSNCAYTVAITSIEVMTMKGVYNTTSCPSFPNLNGMFQATR
jgi:hypothetical protein